MTLSYPFRRVSLPKFASFLRQAHTLLLSNLLIQNHSSERVVFLIGPGC